MTNQRTLSIIKPNAIKKNVSKNINRRIKESGLKIIKQKTVKLSFKQIGSFYKDHKNKTFYKSLCQFMTSGPIIIQILEGKNAVEKNRNIMGDTNPEKAQKNTIRKDFGDSIEANAIHGSDSIKNAKKEINFFFKKSKKKNHMKLI